MKFERFSLGTLCEMKYGKMPPKEVLADDGFPVFTGYRIAGYAKEFLFEQPKVVVVARGVGGTGDVKLSPANAWITNLCIVLDLRETVNQKFLLYKLSNEPLRENLNTGAAQAQITIENLSRYKIAIPSLDIQTKIAAIISAYDDLIENNLKRIALLEESARLLYREWFVRLRFPGYEHTRIVDGVPEGWRKGVVADFYHTASGGTPSRKLPEYFTGEIPWVKTQELNNGFITNTQERITEEGLGNSSAKLFPAKTVLIAMYGATIGQLGILAIPAATNQACCALTPKVSAANYIHSFIFFREGKNNLIGLSMGAAQNNVSQQIIKDYEMTMPSDDLMQLFLESVQPKFELILNLQMQNERLKQARDLLLPRLMNGEIEV